MYALQRMIERLGAMVEERLGKQGPYAVYNGVSWMLGVVYRLLGGR